MSTYHDCRRSSLNDPEGVQLQQAQEWAARSMRLLNRHMQVHPTLTVAAARDQGMRERPLLCCTRMHTGVHREARRSRLQGVQGGDEVTLSGGLVNAAVGASPSEPGQEAASRQAAPLNFSAPGQLDLQLSGQRLPSGLQASHVVPLAMVRGMHACAAPGGAVCVRNARSSVCLRPVTCQPHSNHPAHSQVQGVLPSLQPGQLLQAAAGKVSSLTGMSPAALKATLASHRHPHLAHQQQPLSRLVSGALSEPLGTSEVGSPSGGLLKAVFLR